MAPRKTPGDFIKETVRKPVIVKLNNGHDYRGSLVCLDGFLNVVLQDAEEYQGGNSVASYGEVFLRGNNVLYINADKKGEQ